jgi:hypothetical protein
MTRRLAPSPCRFEQLENRTLLSTVNVVTQGGAIPNDGGNDGNAIQRAILNSASGDTIFFPAGTYDVWGMLSVRDRRTLQGENGTVLRFNTPNGYGMTIVGNAANVTITGLTLQGGGIDMGAGSRYTNINITNNHFLDLRNHGVAARIASSNLNISGNVFENVSAYGAVEIYHPTRLNYSGNRIANSTHGGHILGPLDDCVMSNNYATGLTEWLLEVQDIGSSVSTNMRIENNVAYDYRKGWGNTGGLSIVNHGDGTIIRNNYLRADFRPDARFSENHLHVAIEWNRFSVNSIVADNIIGNQRNNDNYVYQMGFGYYQVGVSVNRNAFYGRFGTGYGGNGTPLPGELGTNTWDRAYSHMPPPPEWTGGGPTGGGGGGGGLPPGPPDPPPPQGPQPGPSNLPATATAGGTVVLQWRDNTSGEAAFYIERSMVGENGPWVPLPPVNPNITHYTNSGLRSATKYWYRVRASLLGNQFTEYSNTFSVTKKSYGGTTGFGGGTTGGGFTNSFSTAPINPRPLAGIVT